VGLGVSDAEVVRLAASLEHGSEHPLAGAILAEASSRGLAPAPVLDFQALAGAGITGRAEGRALALGNELLLAGLGIDVAPLRGVSEERRREGETVMFLAAEGALLGLLSAADPVKATTPEALRLLRGDGVAVVMVTGDSRVTAEAVARRLAIDRVEAEVPPAGKAGVVKALQAEGRVVAVAGDGINDAPALAQAHVGLAMGTGTDVAMQSAGVTLVTGDLRGVARARRLSRATMTNIRQNLFLAFVYNALAIPLAAGVFYPAFGWLLSPMIAAAAMSLSSVSVIANALRLRRVRL